MTIKPEREPLTEGEKKDARAILKGEVAGRTGCVHCAGVHPVVHGLPQQRQPCPRVKRATWHIDGTLLEVEYWQDGQWDTGSTITFDEAFEGWDGTDEDEGEAVS